jgi:hypothetical protein
VSSAHLVGPLWWLFAPIFLIYSKIILHKFLAHLDMCRIGNSDIAFSGPEFQLSAFSLFVQTLHIMREKALELLHKALLCIKTL